MSPTEEEQKLLDILNQPEIESAGSEKVSVEEAIDEAFPGLDEKRRAALATIMEADMPTPEEIEKAERIAQHNREVAQKRAIKQERKKQRRQVVGSRSRKHRKRKGK